jgi:hypothetical protein
MCDESRSVCCLSDREFKQIKLVGMCRTSRAINHIKKEYESRCDFDDLALHGKLKNP